MYILLYSYHGKFAFLICNIILQVHINHCFLTFPVLSTLHTFKLFLYQHLQIVHDRGMSNLAPRILYTHSLAWLNIDISMFLVAL